MRRDAGIPRFTCKGCDRSLPRLPLFRRRTVIGSSLIPLSAHAKDDSLTFPPPPLSQADRDQLFAAVSYTKVQMAAMMPLVTGIYQQTVQAAMQVGFRV